MIKKTATISYSKTKTFEQPIFSYESLSDKELIDIVQHDYNNFRRGGHWICKCGKTIEYDDVMKNTNKNVILKVKCPNCKRVIETFVKSDKTRFDSVEFDILLNRYKNKIKNDCNNFMLEDKDDMYGDMIHRFFIAVMTYNGSSKFPTYLNNLINRRFEDFERKYSRACRTSAVQCKLCGRWVGAITRMHLMNNKHKPIKGFPGHMVLHDKIIDEYGRENFKKIVDNLNFKKLKSESWEGNSYNRAQRKIIKTRIMQTYRHAFFGYNMSINNISINDKNPQTELEYIDTIACKNTYANVGGVYQNELNGNVFFVANSVPIEIQDMCKEYAIFIGNILQKNFSNLRKRKKFKNSFDKDGLILMLERTFTLLFFGYSQNDIAKICGYDLAEIKFWIKQIKKSKEIREKLNFNPCLL